MSTLILVTDNEMTQEINKITQYYEFRLVIVYLTVKINTEDITLLNWQICYITLINHINNYHVNSARTEQSISQFFDNTTCI